MAIVSTQFSFLQAQDQLSHLSERMDAGTEGERQISPVPLGHFWV